MGLRNTVSKQVDKALSIIGDLAVDISLIEANPPTFDPETGLVTATTYSENVVKAVITKAKRYNSSKSPDGHVCTTVTMELLMKVADNPSPSLYDSITYKGEKWDIAGYEGDEYVYIITVTKEG